MDKPWQESNKFEAGRRIYFFLQLIFDIHVHIYV